MQKENNLNYCKYCEIWQENIFDYFSDAVFILSVDNYIIFANHKAKEMIGINLSDNTEFERFFNLTNEQNKFVTLKQLQSKSSDKENTKQNYFLHNLKNNEKYYITLSIFDFVPQKKNKSHFLLIIKDLSEFLESKNEILKKEQKYKHIFDSAPISIWEEDLTEVKEYLNLLKSTFSIRDFEKFFYENPLELKEVLKRIKVLDINQQTLKLFHAKTKEDIVNNFDKIFTKESIGGMIKAILAVLRGEGEIEHSHHINTLTGEKRFISSKMSLSADTGSLKDLHLIICETDLTREKELFDDLTIKNNALKNAITGFMRTDSDFCIQDANPAALKLFGYTKLEEFKNQDLSKLLIFHQDNLQKIINETASWSGEVTAINNKGEKTYCLINFSKVKNDKKKTISFAFSIFDISQRFLADQTIKQYAKQTQKELRRQKEGLLKAQQIQQKMNVKDLPSSNSVDTRAYYLPCEELGGDFMDAAIKGDSLYIILADCTGHGLEASMDSVLIKSICDRHINILIKGNTEAFLEAVNKNVCAYFKEENFLTLFCGHLNLNNNIFTYSNAGAESPFIISSENQILLLNDSKGLHIGFEPKYKYSASTYQLKNNEMLFFYSDAIREMLLDSGEIFGLERLKTIARNFKTNNLDFNIQYIRQEMKNQFKKLPLNDDCSFFWIYLQKPLVKEFVLQGLNKQNEIEQEFLADLKVYGFSIVEQEQILISLSELILNAYHHGNKEEDKKEIIFKYEIDFKEVKFQIEDQGEGFKMLSVSDPCNITRLNHLMENEKEEDFCHGRGIFLIKYYMDEVFYNEKGNQVSVLKKRSPKNTVFHYPLQEDINKNKEKQIVLEWEGEKTLKKVKHNKTADFEINFGNKSSLSSAEITILFQISQAVQRNAKNIHFKTNNSNLKQRFWELGFESLGITIL